MNEPSTVEKGLNYLTQTTVIVGGVVDVTFADEFAGAPALLLAFAAGNFVYIACSDLIPEIKEQPPGRRSLGHFAVFVLGILLMLLLRLGRGWVG